MKRLLLVFIIIILTATPVFADDTIADNAVGETPYSDTVNAVFDRLMGKVFDKPAGVAPGGYDPAEDKPSTSPQEPTTSPEEDKSGGSEQSQDGYLVPGIPDFGNKGTILERMRSDTKVSGGGLLTSADAAGTAVHRAISQSLIALAPLLLIVAAGLMLFSSQRAVGFLLLCGTAILLVLFAPELVQIFINSISGIFQ